MELWLDTIELASAKEAASLGILKGVTTNPSLMAKSRLSVSDLIEKLLETQSGLLAVQVFSNDIDAMCEEAKFLHALSMRIVVKIPMTQNGLKAMHKLKNEKIPILATAIYEPRQALFAFKASASYLALYLGRIKDAQKNPFEIVAQVQKIKSAYNFPGKIMGAGIRDSFTALKCMEMGVCALTLPDNVFQEFVVDSELTLNCLKKFSEDIKYHFICK